MSSRNGWNRAVSVPADSVEMMPKVSGLGVSALTAGTTPTAAAAANAVVAISLRNILCILLGYGLYGIVLSIFYPQSRGIQNAEIRRAPKTVGRDDTSPPPGASPPRPAPLFDRRQNPWKAPPFRGNAFESPRFPPHLPMGGPSRRRDGGCRELFLFTPHLGVLQ